MQSESERGVNSILITIFRFDQLPEKSKDRTFCLVASFSARRDSRGSFSNKIVQNGLRSPSDFVKFNWAQNTYFIFGRKMVVCFVLFCFVATLLQLCPILAYFELRKMLLRKKVFDLQLRNYLSQMAPIFCRFTGFTRIQ